MPTRVGVLLVHGIGEQRRFEHLEGEVRSIAAALEAEPSVRQARVEVRTSPTAAYAAEQQTWRAEDVAPVMVEVTDCKGVVTEIHFREVWWADLDEPATLWTQIRFWGWGLSMWTIRGHLESGLPGYKKFMRRVDPRRSRVSLCGRIRLFMVGVIFLLILLTLSLMNLILRRFPFLNIPGPDILVRYLGDTKLFQQRGRIAKGPLVDIGQPPRVTLRRRMVRALVYMALEDYGRWYVLAHSQGTVLAFNGLMETEHALPNYLDKELWGRCCSTIGAKASTPLCPEQAINMMPCRPAWLGLDDIIDRRVLFSKLHGFLTYGSPLEKFAVLWPAIVPLNEDEAVFQDKFQWINVFDATDPVAGPVKSFQPRSSGPVGSLRPPEPQNVSYKAAWAHLLSHLKYLTFKPGRRNRLVNEVACWLLRGATFSKPTSGTCRWPGPCLTCVYNVARWLIWIAVGLALAVGLGWWFGGAVRFLLGTLPDWICGAEGGCVAGYDLLISTLLGLAPLSWIVALLDSVSTPEFLVKAVLYIIAAVVAVLATGLGRKLLHCHWSGH